MAKFKSLAQETLWVDLGGRLTPVEPGDVIDIPADLDVYVQVGDHGETPLFEAVAPAPSKSKKDGE